MKAWLRHAFGCDSAEPLEPTDPQRRVVDKLCGWLVRRQMTTPVLVALESCRGLNFVGSQAMHFFRPLVTSLYDPDEYHQFALFLEQRGSIDYLCQQLEIWKETSDDDA